MRLNKEENIESILYDIDCIISLYMSLKCNLSVIFLLYLSFNVVNVFQTFEVIYILKIVDVMYSEINILHKSSLKYESKHFR